MWCEWECEWSKFKATFELAELQVQIYASKGNVISSLGSLFIPHRFFLFHTPIIALGKVFSPPTQAKI